jgi:hypothetical protein
MSVPRSAPFLERRTYRRRRLIDLFKMLPLIGLVLWHVPLLWQATGEDKVTSAEAVIYVFSIWFILVLVAALAARALKERPVIDPLDPEWKESTGRGNGQS